MYIPPIFVSHTSEYPPSYCLEVFQNPASLQIYNGGNGLECETRDPVTFSLQLAGIHEFHHVLHVQLHRHRVTIHQDVDQNRQEIIGTKRVFQKSKVKSWSGWGTGHGCGFWRQMVQVRRGREGGREECLHSSKIQCAKHFSAHECGSINPNL